MSPHYDQLAALAAYLAGQRDAIMRTWRDKVSADPRLTTGASLPKAQLNDHLPALLQDFERRLAARDFATRSVVTDEQQDDAAAHGLHRWQQGFDLSEVSRELGRLNECVVAALDQCATLRTDVSQPALAEARSIWAGMYSTGLGASTAQYFQMQQREAAGQVADLEQALETLRQLELQRAEQWQQAAHDLRGNLGVVALATAGLSSARAPAALQQQFLGALDRNVRALHLLLEDVTSLARLQGGQEHRTLLEMDASALLHEMASSVQTAADEARLWLRFDGPQALVVEGDAIKIRRIVQNLVLNALKFTPDGGVSVHWGLHVDEAANRWFIRVTDTGPGLNAGGNAPLTRALEQATDEAQQLAAAHGSGDVAHAQAGRLGAPGGPSRVGGATTTASNASRMLQSEGEGIGLSIVKRLCGLLDATMEVSSSAKGTTFLILLPRRYAPAPDVAAPTPSAVDTVKQSPSRPGTGTSVPPHSQEPP